MQRPFWYLPAHKDSRHLGTDIGTRVATFDYLRQVAQAVDALGYAGVLVPTGTNCEDAWVIASLLAAQTAKMKFIVAVRPGLMAPSAAARMAATFDRMSGGRLIVNVVGGGDPGELAGDGIFLDHDARYALMDEFLCIWRRLVGGEEFSFDGKYLKIVKGNVLFPCVQEPHPPLFMGGSSEAAKRIAVEHIDTLLSWAEPPADLATKLASIRAIAETKGRSIRFGIRLHIIVRETDEAAWAAANDLIRYLDAETIKRSQAVLGRTQSEGQKRMNALHDGGKARDLEVSPNLWAGIALVTGGAGTALVGSPEVVAERLLEYADLGIETFILSGYPHLEEAYRVAETLFPLLPIGEAVPESGPAVRLRARVIPGGW
jgi:alkanesulfonate monooxygenase